MVTQSGKHYLYRHIRLDTGEPFYIGIGKKLENHKQTVRSEYSRAYQKRSRNEFWKNIINKTDYEVEILLESDNYDFIRQKEIEFVSLYGRRDLGKGTLVNLSDGGEGANMSEITKKKLSESHKGKVGLLGELNPMFGMYGNLNPNYGNTWNEEQREHARKVQGAVNREGSNNGRALEVINILTGKIYGSRVELADAEGYDRSTLLCKINGYIYNDTPIIYLHDYKEGLKINYKCDKKYKYKYYIDLSTDLLLGTIKELSYELGVHERTIHLKIKNKKCNITTTENYLDSLPGKIINKNTLIVYNSSKELHLETGLDKNLIVNELFKGVNLTYLLTYMKENPDFKP